MSIMKKIPMIICIGLSLCSVTGRALAQVPAKAAEPAEKSAQTPEKEELIVPLSSPGKPYTLEVSLINGSIEVSSYPGKEILIDVTPGSDNRGGERGRKENRRPAGSRIFVDVNIDNEKGKRWSSRDTVDGMWRINPKFNYEVTATEKDNKVMIQNGMEKNVHLTLKIPQDVKLKLHTVNNGGIEVTDIRGELEISDANGAIKLTNITGSAVANTVNGNITANFVSVDPKAPMAFSTLNGNVDVTLPAGTKSNLKLRSDRGDVYTDFDVAIEKSAPQLDHRDGTSMYAIRLGDWINGKINGGGPEIMMKNMSGNIYVRKAK
jgi:hypothetical protein